MRLLIQINYRFLELLFLCKRVLREQWIRAKYQREEFIQAEKQRYTRGTMEGFLHKKDKLSDTCRQRRFVLSERDQTIKYYVNNVSKFISSFSLNAISFYDLKCLWGVIHA